MIQTSVDVKELRRLLNPYKLLYVEDNLGLKEKATSLFKKLFAMVYEAADGQEGLEVFEKYKPNFVITDIQMPQLNGIEMATRIKEIAPNTKIIITSAYDDKEYLLQSIALKVDGYLIKPMQVDKITSTLYTIAKDMYEEHQKEVFNNYLHNIFNHQDNFIIMLKGDVAVLANEQALNFFDAKTLLDFKEKFKNFNQMLIYHDTFLYARTPQDVCLERIKKDMDKLYNVKILDKNFSPCHFILKLSQMSDDDDFYILSLTDITELNLLALYDKNSLEHDKALQDEKTIYSLLRAAKDGGAVIKLYNFFKGLTVCNNGILLQVERANSIIKTSAMQLKAARLEKKVVLNCELFPCDLQADSVIDVNFQTQTIKIGKCRMLKTTPSQRKYLILEPDSKHKLTIFYEKRKFDTKAHIVNVSKESTKIHLNYLPAGIKEGDEIVLDMVFSDDVKPYIINTIAKVLKIITIEKEFELICIFDLKHSIQKVLIDYLSSRQMKLVKEFKGLKI
ncbi:MAG: response regulator [Sulfurospirillum sp.]|nr:response regulator [Sulfurospirillum sp.]